MQALWQLLQRFNPLAGTQAKVGDAKASLSTAQALEAAAMVSAAGAAAGPRAGASTPRPGPLPSPLPTIDDLNKYDYTAVIKRCVDLLGGEQSPVTVEMWTAPFPTSLGYVGEKDAYEKGILVEALDDKLKKEMDAKIPNFNQWFGLRSPYIPLAYQRLLTSSHWFAHNAQFYAAVYNTNPGITNPAIPAFPISLVAVLRSPNPKSSIGEDPINFKLFIGTDQKIAPVTDNILRVVYMRGTDAAEVFNQKSAMPYNQYVLLTFLTLFSGIYYDAMQAQLVKEDRFYDRVPDRILIGLNKDDLGWWQWLLSAYLLFPYGNTNSINGIRTNLTKEEYENFLKIRPALLPYLPPTYGSTHQMNVQGATNESSIWIEIPFKQYRSPTGALVLLDRLGELQGGV